MHLKLMAMFVWQISFRITVLCWRTHRRTVTYSISLLIGCMILILMQTLFWSNGRKRTRFLTVPLPEL